jgi:hypothetical protein
MCIKILHCESTTKYDSSKSLSEQLNNAKEVIIDYDPKDPDLDKFLGEMEKLVQKGISCNVSLDITHNNHLKGAKAKKQIKRIKKDLDLNEAIKFLVNIHSEFDKQLESISLFCRKR